MNRSVVTNSPLVFAGAAGKDWAGRPIRPPRTSSFIPTFASGAKKDKSGRPIPTSRSSSLLDKNPKTQAMQKANFESDMRAYRSRQKQEQILANKLAQYAKDFEKKQRARANWAKLREKTKKPIKRKRSY